jgi:trigger factor
MEILDSRNDGLKHTFKVKIAAAHIEAELSNAVTSRAKTYKKQGFRPGKVPLDIVRKEEEETLRPQVLRQSIDITIKNIVKDKALRMAGQPKVDLEDYTPGQDLLFTVDAEVLPQIPAIDIKTIAVERLKAPVSDDQVTQRLDGISRSRQTREPLDTPRPSQKGDILVIDFDGRTEDGPIEGGSGKGIELELGSNAFIPGFEDQLIGSQADETRTISVPFPKDYHAKDLAGKDATFVVKVRQILRTVPATIDDAFAKGVGFESLDKLKEFVKNLIVQEQDRSSYLLVKKDILDQLDKTKIDLPQTLVDEELHHIWHEVHPEDHDHKHDGSEEEMAELRTIAARRVRLGLILADLGQKHKVEVTQQELQKALFEQVRRFPRDEKKVYDFYQKNPQALNQLRAPIFEDKVIEVILKEGKVTEKSVTPEQLLEASKEKIGQD